MKFLRSFGILFLFTLASNAQQVVVKDVLGRTITLKKPAKKVLLGEGRDLITLNILDPNPVNLIASWSADFKKGSEYADYKAAFPAVDKIPVVGTNAATFSVEKAIASKPEVAIFSIKGHGPGQTHKEIIAALQSAGIPVIFIDFRTDPFKNTVPSMRILGKVLNKEIRANEFIAFYEFRKKRIADRIAKAKPARPKVFIDMKAGTTENQFSTAGKGNLTPFISLAGAKNIGEDVIPAPLGQLNLEYILTSDPKIYIATGVDSFRGKGVVLGKDIPATEARQSIAKHVSDPVLSELTAVKTGKVYGLWHLFYASPFNILASEAVAKWSHPTLFKDVTPEASLKELNQKFLSVPMTGTYFISLK
ncbi:MAG: iron ABC transporter substrate-binding protein [Pedobacter sp.]|nr:MAG: iron ABC transporter substrate-binding protein [Pedobacter sp.]